MADSSPPTSSSDTIDAGPGESFGMLTRVAIVIAIIALIMFAVYSVT